MSKNNYIYLAVAAFCLSTWIVGHRADKCPYVQERNADQVVYRHKRQALTDACPWQQDDCTNVQDYRYRSIDGSCNNLQTNTIWGKSGTPQYRLLRNTYDNGVNTTRKFGADGEVVATARRTSIMINQDDDFLDFVRHDFTHLLMQWGQFLDHDLVQTPTYTNDDGTELICCADDLEPTSTLLQTDLDAKFECLAMMLNIPNPDPHFNRNCLNFARSYQVKPLECMHTTTTHMEQLNAVTSFIDGSQIYGSNADTLRNVRNGSTPYLSVSGGNFPPIVDSGDHCVTEDDHQCFLAGDIRINVWPGLMAMHVIFLREHNRIAGHFASNTTWDNDKIFYETRKIMAAFLQHISYNHYLPSILGDSYAQTSLASSATGFADMYDHTVDPRIGIEFSTAAYRFGHSQIQSNVTRFSDDGFSEVTRLREMFGRTKYMTEGNGLGLERMVNSLLTDEPERTDRWYTKEITENFFQKPGDENNAQDLAALNAQRGRDNGIATYSQVRAHFGLTVPTEWNAASFPNMVATPITRLSKTYNSTDDIDLYQGGVCELSQGTGAEVGETFLAVLTEQFMRTKIGDRFWYERNGTTGFTEAQLNSIKGITLSRIICDNTDITRIQKNAFKQGDDSKNPLMFVDCDSESPKMSSLPKVDLSLWYN